MVVFLGRNPALVTELETLAAGIGADGLLWGGQPAELLRKTGRRPVEILFTDSGAASLEEIQHVAEVLRSRNPDLTVVMLGSSAWPRLLVAALLARPEVPGAQGLSARRAGDLLRLIGRRRQVAAAGAPQVLTGREIEVLERVRAGMTNAETARALTVSRNTVHRHLANIYRKLKVRNRAEAISWVSSEGDSADAGNRP